MWWTSSFSGNNGNIEGGCTWYEVLTWRVDAPDMRYWHRGWMHLIWGIVITIIKINIVIVCVADVKVTRYEPRHDKTNNYNNFSGVRIFRNFTVIRNTGGKPSKATYLFQDKVLFCKAYHDNSVDIWASTWQNQQSDCAPSEDSDKPGHPPSQIRVFAVRMKKAWVLSYPLSAQRRLIRLGGCPGWSESSLGAQSLCWFCHVETHISTLLLW